MLGGGVLGKAAGWERQERERRQSRKWIDFFYIHAGSRLNVERSCPTGYSTRGQRNGSWCSRG